MQGEQKISMVSPEFQRGQTAPAFPPHNSIAIPPEKLYFLIVIERIDPYELASRSSRD